MAQLMGDTRAGQLVDWWTWLCSEKISPSLPPTKQSVALRGEAAAAAAVACGGFAVDCDQGSIGSMGAERSRRGILALCGDVAQHQYYLRIGAFQNYPILPLSFMLPS
jgi:hypothetical protein